MTPLPTLTVPTSPESHSSSSQTEKPERSRNAKAQARHRAKRKAYIEQLEQTVTKLQNALALSPEQVAALPPPMLKIRELEQENAQLHREILTLRRQLEERGMQLRPDLGRRGSSAYPSFADRRPDRDFKKRRSTLDQHDDLYVPSNNHLPSSPLSIPMPPMMSSNPYSQQPHQRSSSPPLYHPSYGMPSYHMPESSSPSSTSSPSTSSFSQSTEQYSPNVSSHRSSSLSSGHNMLQYSHPMPPFGANAGFVKIEEDTYSSPQGVSQSNGYSTSMSFGANHAGQWPSYTTDRS